MIDVMQMSDSLKVKPTAALRLAEKALTKNPLNADALIGKASILLKRLETNPEDSSEIASEARHCLRIMMQIYDVIGSTGDGTAENPFSVTSVSDYWDKPDIYFDVTRVLLLEGETFK